MNDHDTPPRRIRCPLASLARLPRAAVAQPASARFPAAVQVRAHVLRTHEGNTFSGIDLMTPYGLLSVVVTTPSLEQVGALAGEDALAVFADHGLVIALFTASDDLEEPAAEELLPAPPVLHRSLSDAYRRHA